MKRMFAILFQQKRPIRFLISRFLRDTSILDRFNVTYKYKDIRLRMTRSALSLTLWVEPDNRDEDWCIIASLVENGEIYIDVGAHIGHLTILAANKIGHQGRVYAIEAHPRTFNDLLANLRLNKTENVFAVNVACSNVTGWIKFSDEPNSNDQNRVVDGQGLNILALPLDKIVSENNIRLLKIDTEGYEKFVLEGARDILRNTQFIYFEAWQKQFSRYGYHFSDIYELLKEYGFSLGEKKGKELRVIGGDYQACHCTNVIAWRNSDLARKLLDVKIV
ncbi:MAG: FkbM family methyltransferase [Thermogutta sp.]